MNKELLKKHHFWILFGLVPLLVLIAVILVDSQVGSAIEEANKKITTAKKELDSKKNPSPISLIEGLEKQRVELEKKQTDLWKENWERQIGLVNGVPDPDPAKNLLRWPKAPNGKLDRFNYTEKYATDPNQMKFGATIPNPNAEYREFPKREVYLTQYSNQFGTGMADRVAPTTFNGGWQMVLRHVANEAAWGSGEPRSEQLWLVLEDMWIQRALLGQIRAVNEQIASFERVNDPTKREDPLSRAFQSRNWRVNLTVKPDAETGRYKITGSLMNITDRLQLIGNGNSMTLKVWWSNDVKDPFEFRIGGDSVAGGATMEIISTKDHVLPPGVTPAEIAKVEQVFDSRTVPIRQIDRIVLGKTDSRYAKYQLLPPDIKAYKDPDPSTTTSAPASGSQPGVPPASPGPLSGNGPGGMGGMGGASGATGPSEGAGVLEVVTDANKKRYIGVPGQVRRMPIALSVVVDQAYVQDVLMAYANSPLRFQITQVQWDRFRGTLTPVGSTEADDNGPRLGAAGQLGEGFLPNEGRPGFGQRGGSPFGPVGPGIPSVPAMGSGLGGLAGSAGGATVTEGQITAGLVQLTIYGIISIYEKYQSDAPTGN